MARELKPLYATIPYFGGSWHVMYDMTDYDGTGTSCASLEGYGEFPRWRFPGIPLIDFRTLGERKFPSLPYVAEAQGVKSEFAEYAPLQRYVELCREAGILVT